MNNFEKRKSTSANLFTENSPLEICRYISAMKPRCSLRGSVVKKGHNIIALHFSYPFHAILSVFSRNQYKYSQEQAIVILFLTCEL